MTSGVHNCNELRIYNSNYDEEIKIVKYNDDVEMTIPYSFDDFYEMTIYIKYCPFCGEKLL